MEKEILKVINDYDKALTLLDCYDHQTLIKPKGNQTIYKLDYNECRMLIDMMKFESSLFGVEKMVVLILALMLYIKLPLVKKYINQLKKKLQIYFILLQKTIHLLMEIKELLLVCFYTF